MRSRRQVRLRLLCVSCLTFDIPLSDRHLSMLHDVKISLVVDVVVKSGWRWRLMAHSKW